MKLDEHQITMFVRAAATWIAAATCAVGNDFEHSKSFNDRIPLPDAMITDFSDREQWRKYLLAVGQETVKILAEGKG